MQIALLPHAHVWLNIMKDHWDLQWPKWMKRYRKLWTDKKNDNNSLYQHLTSCCISNIILLIKNQRKSESCPKRTHPSLLIQNAKYIPTLSADRRVQWCFRIWEVGRGRGNLNIVSCKINLLQICTQFFFRFCATLFLLARLGWSFVVKWHFWDTK